MKSDTLSGRCSDVYLPSMGAWELGTSSDWFDLRTMKAGSLPRDLHWRL